MQVNELEEQKVAWKKSLAISIASMALYQPTLGFKVRTFKLCLLNRWDFNFCVHSSPLRERSTVTNTSNRVTNTDDTVTDTNTVKTTNTEKTVTKTDNTVPNRDKT